ncbi:hypothetical protein Hanom_Chr06g00479061 [Helianthus anomalus]
MYIHGLVNLESRPFKEPTLELEFDFDFERRRSTKNDTFLGVDGYHYKVSSWLSRCPTWTHKAWEVGTWNDCCPSLGGFHAQVYIFNCHHQMKMMLSSLHM